MKISLLGKIPKGDEERKGFAEWYTEFADAIAAEIPDAIFLHGDLLSDKEGPERVVGHDLWLIKHADVVVVDARQKIGAGTAQEMVLTKQFQRPLVSVIPKDSHHRRSNVVFGGEVIEDWVHPFLAVSSDYVATSIEDATNWIKEFKNGEVTIKTKDISVFEEAISAFESGLPDVVEEYRKRGWNDN